ncbi:MAG TPA: RnfH family protein [Burkholderiaceae bacterium]|nr:RnfH family protein [Burkholderiaceae bacterium]
MWHVEVAWSPAPREVQLVALQLPAGATVRDALLASRLQLDWSVHAIGIWGQPANLEDPLRDGDRVEVYRALRVDPKEARRLRYRAQGQGGRAARRKA